MENLFDCHCDTLTKAMEYNQNIYDNIIHLDIKRLSRLKKAVQIFAIWLEPQYLSNAYKNTVEAIKFFNSQLEQYGEYFENITTSEGLKTDNNKVKAILSVEGGEAIEGSIDKLHILYNKGVRLMTLTWNNINEIGYGALSIGDEGLTDFGFSVVKEMNKMNMLIDVSHLNEKGFWDVYETTEKPFIATHSNSYSICNHKRNLRDDQLKAIAECKGAIGLNLYPPFLTNSDDANIDDLLRHIDYILNKTGENVLGMGTDYDGIGCCPKELEDISRLHLLYAAVEKNFGKRLAEKIFYENMETFFENNLN